MYDGSREKSVVFWLYYLVNINDVCDGHHVVKNRSKYFQKKTSIYQNDPFSFRYGGIRSLAFTNTKPTS